MKDTTWTELAPRLLAVPLGATEQHGPHLPFTVDTEIAVALCERLARQREDVLVAPALPYGSSGEHAGFPGTLSIGQEATEQVLVELVRSADGFAGVVLVCAHGGNAGPLRRAVAKLRYEGRNVCAWCPGGPSDDSHAGRTETSVMLALRPAAVRLDRLQAGNTTPLPELIGPLREGGVRAVSPNGVLGDPAGASAEEGRETLLRWVGSLLNAVGTLASDVMMKPSAPATHVTKR
ncbi:mycofactocin biosynthesis peptidyl-dipeptidase MftE [Amycolatopsis acidiphila]|uniref:Mycofactocin biosynthesis peptidyl-dipeptidase MftE n=1 Tax=Amycolatopsis acidiphila TaxID=715473 RepID=A0A558A7F9_9PSEU|nr:mycofactocin biosynthesis peptidyl-dipeptidase MftE [Amycolatopsis acidiphila]TVT20191.1 mycofactocin biosynthesis peptidyl-dipeptidase MftE [Amycolatopsis acidiphila]UIJ58264.1 mycofactocin biosynthesis peptidyl-dipeptidase MftE [Amycolatopsis acidiphila]GHG69113.1 mycofactocin system creatininase family protein [Amycolatopsis acidiphila]